MIIIFELPLSILVRQNRTTLQTAVSCLLAVHRTGKNLTIFERNSAEWLCQNIPLIEQDLAALRRIQQQYTQLGNLVNVASCCIKIEPEGTLFSSNSQGTKVHLPIDYCKFYEIIQAPLLIVEDVDSDRLVFDFVFKNYPRNHHNIYYEVCHGGGEAAIRVAKAKVSEDRIVVLIADSDRSSPLSPNTKFERFRKEKEQIGWPLLFIHVLPVHEIENIFGLSVYERVGIIPNYSKHTNQRKRQ